MKNIHIKVFTDKKIFKNYAWRGMVTTCPHCREEPPKSYEAWHRPVFVDGVFLSLNMPNWKTDSIAVFSVCPLCGKKSWCHDKLNRDTRGESQQEKWPKQVQDAMAREYRRRLNKAIVEWNQSPCSDCTAIKELDLMYLYFHRYCAAGSGGPLDPNEKCSKRIPRKPVVKKRRPAREE